MDNKILVIYGPTGVGKTSFALDIAKKFNGDILSADSRQVYRWMDIITGKDIPVNSKFEILNLKTKKNLNHWKTPDGMRIWLIDLVDPKDEFNVAQWVGMAREAINLVRKDGKLPIIVGGTAFYIKSLISNVQTLEIRPNKKLRESLSGKNAEELFETLASVDGIRAAEMNQSDKKNPRRLIRGIEVALSKRDGSGNVESLKLPDMDALLIGLKAPKEILFERIDRRVDERVAMGAVEEVKRLLKRVSWNNQSMTGIGYRELKEYFMGGTLNDAVSRWKRSEHNYAKRQLLWFKNDKRFVWFDIQDAEWSEKVEKLVKNWYNK